MFSFKMLKLICLHQTYRPSLIQSLTLGYTHILTRFVSRSATIQVPQLSLPVSNPSPAIITGYSGGTGKHLRLLQKKDRENLLLDQRQQNYSTLLDIGYEAEQLLGDERFSINSGMTYNFGTFSDIIILFSFKVAHIDHPILHLIKILEADFNNKAQEEKGVNNTWKTNPYPLWRSMMILLATEMFGYKNEILEPQSSKDSSTAAVGEEDPKKLLIDRHVRLSKIVEIAYITEEIHKRILDVSDIQEQGQNSSANEIKHEHVENLHRANKAATLIGDLLWTQNMVQLGALKCQLVTELICKFLVDYCESEFIFGNSSAKSDSFNYNSWVEKATLSIGSLMGNTMSSMVYFSGHDDELRNKAYKLGSLLGMTYQAYNDVRYFEKDELKDPNWLDVGMLPVVHKIQSEPDILNLTHSQIFEKVKEDQQVMSNSISDVLKLQEDTLKYIESLAPYCDSNSSSQKILSKFIETLKL